MSNGATDWSSFLCFTAENLGHSTNKGNSLARSNASLYGNKEELYDRLRRHAYQGKKGKQIIVDTETDEIAHLFIFFSFLWIQQKRAAMKPPAKVMDKSDIKHIKVTARTIRRCSLDSKWDFEFEFDFSWTVFIYFF